MFENAPWEFLTYFSAKSDVYEAARQWRVQIEQNVQFMVFDVSLARLFFT